MRILKNLLTSVWVWLAVIGAVSWFTYQATKKRDADSEKIEQSSLEIPKTAFATIGLGIVEIEGGIINVSANRSGTFTKVLVSEGDVVKTGQLLAIQEDRDERIRIRSAEIAIEKALISTKQNELDMAIKERELGRAKLQRDQDAISQQQYDNISDALKRSRLSMDSNKINLESLHTNLETARFNLAQKRLISPVDGRILEAAVNAGSGVSTVNVSTAFKIIPDAPKRVRINLNEANIDKVFIGQEVKLSRASDRTISYTGHVSHIAEVFSAANNPSGSRGGSNTIEVLIKADELPLRLGQSVLAQFMKPVSR